MNNKLNNNFSLKKLLLTALVAGPLATLPAPLWALPDVTSANLTTSAGVTTQVVGSTLNVTSPDKAILTWQAFGSGASPISAGDVINYFLPSSTSSVLNSVSGGAASTISGSIISNGNVYVLNPAGIVLTPTAQVNAGGFYASTVAEPSGFFSINGSLSFAGTSTSNITVQGTGTTSGTDVATIQAVGPGNNIYLAGNQVNVNGGKFYGNLFVRSSGAGTNTTFGSTGAVSVNLVGVPLAGGGLNITTNGGNVVLTGAGALTVAPSVGSTTGAVSINTTGNGVNGTITQGAGAFVANTTGTVVTLNAGTGTTAANITLGVADFLTVGATGQNVSITDTAGGVVLNGTTTVGTLAVTSAGAITQGSGTHSIGGTITLSPSAGSTVSFTGTGNLTFANFGANPGTTTISTSGDLTFANINSTANGLTLTSTGGQITATSITSTSTLTITANSAAGKLTSSSVQGNTSTISVAGDISVATQLRNNGGSTMSVTSSTGNISVGAVTSSSTLNLTATAGSITATGTIQTNTLNVTAANGSVTTAALSTANTAVISSGSVTVNGNINANSSALTITATTGSISTTGTITTNSTLTLSAPSASGSITTGLITSTTTRTVGLSSGGSVTLAGGTVPVLSVTSTGGSITQSAAITSANTATFNAAGDITLTNAANAFNTVVLQGGASATAAGFKVVDADSIVIGTGTNARAATSISTTANGTITLGNAAIDTLAFGSTLSLTASGTGTIGTNANTVTVFGNVTLNTTNTAATLGSNIFGNAANYQFGQISGNVGTGALNVYENTTLNLGGIVATSIDARSFAGDIVNTGTLAVTNVAVYANSIFSPGNVSLTNTANVISGTVTISNAKDFSLVNNGNTAVVAGSTANGKAATGTTNVTVVGTNANTLNLSVANGGDFNVVSFSAPGAVTIVDPNAITLQNIVTPFSNNQTIAVTAQNGVLTLGSGIALGGSGSANFVSQGAAAGIVDSAPNIKIFGPASFNSANSISITNAGHSLGAVSLATTGVNGVNGTANITYTEGGSANLNVVALNTSNDVNVPVPSLTVVSTGGDIIQTAVTGSISVPSPVNGTNSASFTSNAGRVALTNPAGTNAIIAPVTVSAAGNSTIVQSNNVILGNVAVTAGTFTADTSASAAKTIAQATGTTVKSYGNATFNTQGAKITLTNSGNNFGGLTLLSNTGAAAGADIAITETGTLNFVSVNSGTAGKLAATSENAGIIQSGTGGLIVGGATTLTAAAAGITLNTGTTNNSFGGATNNGILVTTVGNVSIQDSNATTILAGNSTIGGSLILKNTNGAGTIKDSPGTLTVSGNVLFDTTTNVASSVSIGSSTASLGAIQFRSGTVTIVENATLNLAAGSVASGPVSLTSSGNIVTSGSGGGTFQNTLALNASGSITITNPIFVNGAGGSGLTFRALGAVDLSALSLAGNLNSIAPTNLGASSYKAPSP